MSWFWSCYRTSTARKLSSTDNKIEIIVEDQSDEDQSGEDKSGEDQRGKVHSGDDQKSEDAKDILITDNTEMDNFQFDQQDDIQVENQEHFDKVLPTEDLPVNVTVFDLNEKDVPVIPETTEKHDNEPFIELYINLIPMDYEYFGHDDTLYYDGIEINAYISLLEYFLSYFSFQKWQTCSCVMNSLLMIAYCLREVSPTLFI